jgi:hypothetical protein
MVLTPRSTSKRDDRLVILTCIPSGTVHLGPTTTMTKESQDRSPSRNITALNTAPQSKPCLSSPTPPASSRVLSKVHPNGSVAATCPRRGSLNRAADRPSPPDSCVLSLLWTALAGPPSPAALSRPRFPPPPPSLARRASAARPRPVPPAARAARGRGARRRRTAFPAARRLAPGPRRRGRIATALLAWV